MSFDPNNPLEPGEKPPSEAPPPWLAPEPAGATPPPPPPQPPPPPASPPPGASWEPAPAPPPPADPAAAAYPAAPAYPYAPQAGIPAAPARRGNMRAIVGLIVVVAIVATALIGYGVAGYAYATSRISGANSALNTVIDHENSISSTTDNLTTKLAGTNVTSKTTTVDDLKAQRKVSDQLVTNSQNALPTITSDDASLAAAADTLNQQQWLTVLSRDRLNHEADRITHARKALSDQKTITGDYVQLGQYFQAFLDGNIDVLNIGTKLQANDLTGTFAALSALKTDAAKGLQLASAPGLPAEVKQYQTDLQLFESDFEKFMTATDQATIDTYLKKIEGDAVKVDAYDWTKIGNQVVAFYQPMIDDYNAEGKKASS